MAAGGGAGVSVDGLTGKSVCVAVGTGVMVSVGTGVDVTVLVGGMGVLVADVSHWKAGANSEIWPGARRYTASEAGAGSAAFAGHAKIRMLNATIAALAAHNCQGPASSPGCAAGLFAGR